MKTPGEVAYNTHVKYEGKKNPLPWEHLRDQARWEEIAKQVRIQIIDAVIAEYSGHQGLRIYKEDHVTGVRGPGNPQWTTKPPQRPQKPAGSMSGDYVDPLDGYVREDCPDSLDRLRAANAEREEETP